MRTIAVLLALAAVFGSILIAGTAAGKGPDRVRAEISGGDLSGPVATEEPLSMETVFLNDSIPVAPPRNPEPAYTVKLTPEQPDGATGQYPVLMTLTYFPGDGEGRAVLSGDWDTSRYFEASAEFRALVDGVIAAASPQEGDGVSALWYVAPGLATVGLVLVGGLAGRRLLFRR